MTYQQAIDFLYNDLEVFQKSGASAYKPSLKNIKLLCDKLGNPQTKFKTIHIAGTNGKGSTAHMLSSILQENGYKTGLHTSPHLVSFTERNKINGEEMHEDFVVSFVSKNREFIKELKASFFEVVVAMGFDYFYHHRVDVAVIETGLGGRLDATNIISPEVSIITNVGLDHVNILGKTLQEIAKEKAGIIKQGIPVVVGDKRNDIVKIFKNIALEKSSQIYYPIDSIDNIQLDLKGLYQKENAKTVLASVEVLRNKGFIIDTDSVHRGLANVVENTGLKGRWQIVNKNPFIVLDTAHNSAGFEQIKKQLKIYDKVNKIFVLGFVSDKDVSEILKLLPEKQATYIFCEPSIPRAFPIDSLKEIVPINYKAHYYKSLNEAYSRAREISTSSDMIYIGGSNFIVGEFLENNIEA